MALSVRTLLFTDIEGSTALVQRAGEQWPELLHRHRAIVRAAIARWGGVEHGTEGDSFFVSFDSPSAGLAAAVQAQLEMEGGEWPDDLRLRVRMGLHLGEVADDDEDLVGLSVHHAARIAATAHGGQVVLSAAVRDSVRNLPQDAVLVALGSHRLRDVGTVAMYQVEHPQLQRGFPDLRGVLGSRTNLPRLSSAFVGGEQLLSAIGELVQRSRVVTLTGSGGVGKTRAALEFAWQQLDEFHDGVFFVDLAPISDEGAVPATLAATLPMVSTGVVSMLDAIIDWVANRRLLIVLDNCEHLLDEVTLTVHTILSACNQLHVIATSREPLGLAGERVHRVPSLDVLGDAVTLFCERATEADSSFVANGHEAVLKMICARLDGIPLAIELAAARMRSLSPEDLLERLQDRFRLLRGSGRGTLERHQTLRATVSWSYQLLTTDEQVLFDRLSVFSGGFTLHAAESVCGSDSFDEIDVVDLLDQLVDKSMVVAERRTSSTRYRLLETLRQYGEEQLDDRGETSALRDRHQQNFTLLASELGASMRTSREVEAKSAMDAEWDNLRAAHQWALSCRNLDGAEQIVTATKQFAFSSVRHEHSSWTKRTLELAEETSSPSTALYAISAEWANLDGDEEESHRLAQRGIDAAPFPEHHTTMGCWGQFAGASPRVLQQSSAALEAFRHMQAAFADIHDVDTNWGSLVDLVDASMHADPTATKRYRQQLQAVASRVRAQSLLIFSVVNEGHALLRSAATETPGYVTARVHYERALEMAQDAGHTMFETQMMRAIALTATGSDADDALERCRDGLDALYELRYWQKLWQVLESVTLALAKSGRTAQAAVVLGHLDAHMPGYGLEEGLGFRDLARALIVADGGHTQATERGARLSAEELVTAALGFLSPTNA